MKIAISNIAWDVSEDEQVADLLNRYSVDAIDIAPGKYFPDPKKANDRDIQRVRAWWAQRGIEITGMQSLLFGTTGLNLFGSADVQDAMLEQLGAVCRIGSGLGAARLVFGSPKNRDRTGLSPKEATEMAINFFEELGDIAHSHRVKICIEANPERYGCNFMTRTEEAAKIVRAVEHPAIRLQLDTGTIAINQENAEEVVLANADLIGHVHASEPDLVPLGDGPTQHHEVAMALASVVENQVVSIEMLAPKDEPHLVAIERALKTGIKYYRLPS